jgi:group II intron reverse transcriptase/maturase
MGENPRPPKAEQENNQTVNPGILAESVEERGVVEGTSNQDAMSRMQGRTDMPQALERVRQAATKDKGLRFTALLHHVYSIDILREAFFALKRDAAPGVDGVTWRGYALGLEDNLQDLSARLKRGAYRARPGRRAYIPKADGKQRPLGVIALEDKLVQRATTQVLNAIYETDFLGFSYGFRPERGPHNALDALYVGQWTKKVNWVLDADIRGFFDAIDREWLMKFVEHRIADRRVHRLIQKWLKAGVLEDGELRRAERGTVQGGSISPLLANVYLHYVLDLWVQQWREREAKGDVIFVRYADDFIVGFQHKHEAERFLSNLKDRLAKFKLELHPEKTRLIEFGPGAAKNRAAQGESKPETFNFLGFTHVCHKTSRGRFTVLRQTIRKRLTSKLSEVKEELRRRMHDPIPRVGEWLKAVVSGHFRYYGVPMNQNSLFRFRFEVARLWWWTLNRRSQLVSVPWKRMRHLVDRYLPAVAICHPYPLERLGVWT